MPWFKLHIAEGAGRSFQSLCRAFQRAFISAGAPADMALFTGSASRDGTREVYLSSGSHPYVEDLIRHHRGHTCTAPDPETVTMVYGVPGAESRLFSDQYHHHSTRQSTLV